MSKRPLNNKFFSWLAIGIIIYVLFFHKQELPDGTKVTSMQYMLAGHQNKLVTPPSAPEGQVINQNSQQPSSEITSSAIKDFLKQPDGADNPFLKEINENPNLISEGMAKSAAEKGNFLAEIIQGVIGITSRPIKMGSGEVVYCGQDVTVHYKEYMEEDKIIFSSYEKEPIKFKLGSGDSIKALDIGVIGMKKGGQRRLTSPARYSHFHPQLGSGNDLLNTATTIEVELLDFSPIPELKKQAFGLKMYDDAAAMGPEIFCGDTVMINYKIWDMQNGKLLASTLVEDTEYPQQQTVFTRNTGKEPSTGSFVETISQPVMFRLGDDKAPLGMEIALLNDYSGSHRSIRVGGKRTIITPPRMLKTLNNKTPSSEVIDIKLPEKVLLIEIEVVDKILNDNFINRENLRVSKTQIPIQGIFGKQVKDETLNPLQPSEPSEIQQ